MKIIIGKYEATIYPEGGGYTGAISLGHDAAGKRLRVKRKGRTKTQVKDKLRQAADDLEAGIKTDDKYSVKDAVNDFLDQGMKGKASGTVGNYRSLADNNLIPQIGAAKLKELTADDLDKWMDERAEELSTRSLRLIHQILERAIRHAQARDKVRRNVASLINVPEGQEGRPSKAMTLDQAVKLLETLETATDFRLFAYVIVSLLAGVRTEEARALTWAEVDLDAGTVAVYRSVRAKGDTKTRKIQACAQAAQKGRGGAQGTPQAPSGRTAPRRRHVARPRSGLLPRGRHATRSLARAPRVRQNHQGGRTRRGLDSPRTAPLVRVDPQRQRRPDRGHQRPGRATAAHPSPKPSTGTRSGPRSPPAPRP